MLTLVIHIAMASSAISQQFNSPTDLIETLYGSYFNSVRINDFDPYFSEELTSQIDKYNGVLRSEVLGFDPFVGIAKWDPRDFRSELLNQTSANARVKVAFVNQGTPVTVTFTLIREQLHGWQIDHIVGAEGARSWCSNTIISSMAARVEKAPKNALSK